MPDQVEYSPGDNTLTIGRDGSPDDYGIVENVSPAVWAYTVGGGVPVVRRWISYRLHSPRHKRRTSPLDDINPTRWTAQFDDELLDLLNVLDRCVALEPRQTDLVDRICSGPQLTVADLEESGVLPVPARVRRPQGPSDTGVALDLANNGESGSG